jgi:hypothetical protein
MQNSDSGFLAAVEQINAGDAAGWRLRNADIIINGHKIGNAFKQRATGIL